MCVSMMASTARAPTRRRRCFSSFCTVARNMTSNTTRRRRSRPQCSTHVAVMPLPGGLPAVGFCRGRRKQVARAWMWSRGCGLSCRAMCSSSGDRRSLWRVAVGARRWNCLLLVLAQLKQACLWRACCHLLFRTGGKTPRCMCIASRGRPCDADFRTLLLPRDLRSGLLSRPTFMPRRRRVL